METTTANNEIQGSFLITATPTLNSGDNAGPFHKTVANASEAKEAIEAYYEKGYDFIKVYDDINLSQLKSIETAAKKKNMYIAGHPPKISFKELLSSDLVSIEHVEELRKFLDRVNSEESIRSIAKQIKQSGKAVTINLVAFHRVYKTSIKGLAYLNGLVDNAKINPITAFIGKKQLGDYTEAGSKYKAYATKKYNTLALFAKILSEEGVRLLFGTDSGPNFIEPGASVIEEIELLSEAGISNFEILKSATINAAHILDKTNIGQVKVGANADLLLLEENPLKNIKTISTPKTIFSDGYSYNQDEIIKLRLIGENKQNTYATIGLFLEHLFIN